MAPAVTVDHTQVIGTCGSCHNGTIATGKNPTHITSGNNCDDCHTTTALGSGELRSRDITGNCVSCHNGTDATGKSATAHQYDQRLRGLPQQRDLGAGTTGSITPRSSAPAAPATTAPSPPASTRRTSRAATPATTAIRPTAGCPRTSITSNITGNCVSCHNGTDATGKSPTHIQTTNVCEDCHNKTLWTPVDHGRSHPGHRCVRLLSRRHHRHRQDPTHITSGDTCDDCHTTVGWLPANFDHIEHHRQLRQLPQRHRGDRQEPTHIQTRRTSARTATTPNMWSPGDSPSITPRSSAPAAPAMTARRHRQAPDAHSERRHLRRLPHDRSAGYRPRSITSASPATAPAATTASMRPARTRSTSTRPTSARTAIRPTRLDAGRNASITPRSSAPAAPVTTAPRRPASTPSTYPSGDTCDDCHTTDGWLPATFDHATSRATASAATTAPTRPARIPNAHQHDQRLRGLPQHRRCGRPVDTVDHTQVLGTCGTCHDGVIATGKHPTHIASGNNCDDCHTTVAWLPANVRPREHHGQLRQLPQRHRCDRQEPAALADHERLRGLPQPDGLDAGRTVDHTQVLGSCSSCHNGTIATGQEHQPLQHIAAVQRVPQHHLVDAARFPPYRTDLRAARPPRQPACTNCHRTNTEVVAWTSRHAPTAPVAMQTTTGARATISAARTAPSRRNQGLQRWWSRLSPDQRRLVLN